MGYDTHVYPFLAQAGAGSSVLGGCGADLFLTGEMSHHEVIHESSRTLQPLLLVFSELGFGKVGACANNCLPLFHAVCRFYTQTPRGLTLCSRSTQTLVRKHIHL